MQHGTGKDTNLSMLHHHSKTLDFGPSFNFLDPSTPSYFPNNASDSLQPFIQGKQHQMSSHQRAIQLSSQQATLPSHNQNQVYKPKIVNRRNSRGAGGGVHHANSFVHEESIREKFLPHAQPPQILSKSFKPVVAQHNLKQQQSFNNLISSQNGLDTFSATRKALTRRPQPHQDQQTLRIVDNVTDAMVARKAVNASTCLSRKSSQKSMTREQRMALRRQNQINKVRTTCNSRQGSALERGDVQGLSDCSVSMVSNAQKMEDYSNLPLNTEMSKFDDLKDFHLLDTPKGKQPRECKDSTADFKKQDRHWSSSKSKKPGEYGQNQQQQHQQHHSENTPFFAKSRARDQERKSRGRVAPVKANFDLSIASQLEKVGIIIKKEPGAMD